MKTEFEIRFYPVDFSDIRKKLESIGAFCIAPQADMRRVIFANPLNPENSYARVRDEGGGIVTCTYKNILPGKLSIESVQEIECKVSDFESMKNIFLSLGIPQKAFQETRRETWEIESEWVQFMLDEWPWLEPFIEIEAENEEKVRKYTEKLGFTYSEGFFGAADSLYEHFLGIPKATINTLPEITFANPPKKQ